jgi:hypothetical protein
MGFMELNNNETLYTYVGGTNTTAAVNIGLSGG